MSSGSPERIDFLAFPTAEDDEYEFKSSATSIKELGKKVACAVSAFANSGGGRFVAGVDSFGNADGGLPEHVGRQDLRDWCDQLVHQVEPVPRYTIDLISDAQGRGSITSAHFVLVITVLGSHMPPHMGPDGCYYIRAGAHTVRARHFIVDALFSKRNSQKPRLSHIFRFKPNNEGIVQLGIIALTPSPALDVEITLWPIPEILRGSKGSDYFPVRVPVIDVGNPFYMDATTWYAAEDRFGESVELQVKYRDLANDEFTHEARLSIHSSLPQIVIGKDWQERVAKALEKIHAEIKK